MRLNRKILFLIIILLPSLGNAAHQIKVSGYFISNKNDTVKTDLYVMFSLDDFLYYSEGIEYLDSSNKKKTLTPEMAKEIHFTYRDKREKFISKEYHGSCYNFITRGGKSGHNCFFFRVIDDYGYLKLYNFSLFKAGSEVLQKGSDSLFFTNFGVRNREKIIQYYFDCPDLAKKIEKKETISSLGEVMEYNRTCAKK